MNEITLSDLTEFTVSELWPLTCQITESTSLNYDFKISGLDGLEFMCNGLMILEGPIAYN